MGREHDPETVWQAQELYCVDRMTFEQVAEALGVADSTLRRWADTYGWRSKRDEIAQAESDLRADKIRARSKLLKSLISTADAQTGFAVAAMENLALKEIEAARALKAEAAPRFQEQQALPEVPAEAGDIAALEQGVRQRLAALLLSPDLKVRDVKDLTAILERLARTARHGREETKDGQGKEPITYVLEDGDA
jgi:transposase-like protein